VPPSLHGDTGEVREWESQGDFGQTDFETLNAWVAKIAAAALLVRYWPRGFETPQAIAGMLARAEWPEEASEEFVTAIIATAQEGNRADVEKARREVRNTYERVERGQEIFGRAKLVECFGEHGKKIVSTVTTWLGIKRDGAHAVAAGKLIVSAHGDALPLLANALTVLRSAPEWQGTIGLNEFSLHIASRKTLPWAKPVGSNWEDVDDYYITEWLQHRGVHVNPNVAGSAVQTFAKENKFHPVKEYLDALKWDGKSRINAWLSKYLGVERSTFADAVGSRWLISGIARIMDPGCQVDHVLLLEGAQGIQKSAALRALAGKAEWFTDHVGNLDNKDSQLGLHGIWIIEFAELNSLKGKELETVKSFISCRDDYFRAPYARRHQHVPRTNIFAGSTNAEMYLEDPTGGRRFWPVTCGALDIEGIDRDKDQLWAEAYGRYVKGSKWWLENETLNEEARKEQEKRYEPGVWDDAIETWLENPVRTDGFQDGDGYCSGVGAVCVEDILIQCVGKSKKDFTQRDRLTVVRCLTHAGWKGKKERIGERSVTIYRPARKEK
jgi:predicted P-loop ATPase